jgi:hypothetical protein
MRVTISRYSPQTGLEEVNGHILEADCWTVSEISLVWLRLPAQAFDATSPSALIRQCFRG